MGRRAPQEDRSRPFVGRRAELDTLVESLTPDAHAHGRLLLVRGEPGIGKSTLITRALTGLEHDAGPVLRATADAMDQRRPFGLLLDALGTGDADTQKAVASVLQGQRAVPGLASARSDVTTGEQILDLIDVLAARGPFTLVLEDLQWADSGSLNLLTRLCRTLHQQPLAILGSKRPLPRPAELDRLISEAESRHVLTSVELGPLSAADTITLTEAVTRARVDDAVLRQVEAAGGNPLFLQELLGVLIRDGSLTVTRDGTARLGAAPAPAPSLALMIMNHLAGLSAPAREVLVLASVLGTRFPIADLRLIAGRAVSELRVTLSEVIEAGVLVEDGPGALAFRHSLIREVLVGDVPAPVRGELHLEAALRLHDADAPPVSVAEHLLRVPPAVELVPLTLELADRVRTSSPETAVELWHRVIECTSPLEEQHVRATAGSAQALLTGGRTAEAATLVRDVLEGGMPGAHEGELRATLAHALLLSGDIAGAQAEADSAAQRQSLTAAERAAHLSFAGWPRLLVGQTEEALEHARRAEGAAVASDNVAARVFSLLLQGRILAARGDLADGLRLLSDAVAAVDGADAADGVAGVEAFPHQLLGGLLADLDRVPESLALFERGRRLAEHLGYLPGVLASYQLCAQARALSGHVSDVEADLDARDSVRGRVDVRMEGPVLGMRAWVALHRDGPDSADPWLRQLGDVREVTGVGRGLVWIYGPASRNALLLGDTRAAFDVLWHGWERCLARNMPMDCVEMGVPLAGLAVAVGEPGRAGEIEEVVTDVSGRNPAVVHLTATSQVVRGLVHGDLKAFVEGVDLLAATPRRMAHARAAELATVALARSGDTDQATALGEAALHGFREIGASHDAERARSEFSGLGLRLHGPRAAPRPTTGWGALTRTEELVARQVATGLSNPEVAEILFVSRRTIESHVSHVLAKLGLRSRAELVLFVARRAHELDERSHELEPPAERRLGAISQHHDIARGRASLVERDLDEHASRSHFGPEGVVRGLTDL